MDKTEAMKKAEELLPHYGAAHGIIAGAICPCIYHEDAASALLSVDEQAEKRGYDRRRRECESISDEIILSDWRNLFTPSQLDSFVTQLGLLGENRERRGYAKGTEAMEALRRYVIQRGNENEKRSITAYGADATWHSAKAETYRNIESRLDDLLTEPVGERSEKRDIPSLILIHEGR